MKGRQTIGQAMASLRVSKHRCLVDVGTQLLSTVNCELCVKHRWCSPSKVHTAEFKVLLCSCLSHLCEDEDDIVDNTIWVDLTNFQKNLSVMCDCDSRL